MAARQHQNRPHEGSVFGSPDPDTFVSHQGDSDDDGPFARRKRTPLSQPKPSTADAQDPSSEDYPEFGSEHLNLDVGFKDRAQPNKHSEDHHSLGDNGTSQNLAWDDLGLVDAPQPADSPFDSLPDLPSLELAQDSYPSAGGRPVAIDTQLDAPPDELLFSPDNSPETGTATMTAGPFEPDARVVEVGEDGFALPLTVDDASERFGDPAVFEDEGVTHVDLPHALPIQDPEPQESNDVPSWLGPNDTAPIDSPTGDIPHVTSQDEGALISVSEAEAERFQRDIAEETWHRLTDQAPDFATPKNGSRDPKPELTMDLERPLSPAPRPIVQEQEAAESIAIIESRNTSIREVVLTPEEFALAQRQIVENGFINIPGKAVVLEAVAITRHPADGSTPRRRRRRA